MLDTVGVTINTVRRPVGCESCSNTGYSGRVAIFEILEVTSNIKQAISDDATEEEILIHALKSGMEKIVVSGLRKVSQGVTSLEEVYKVVL